MKGKSYMPKVHPELIRFKNWECDLIISKYAYTGRTALELRDHNTHEQITKATVNIIDCPLEPDEVIIKNYSENEGMLTTLQAHNIVGPVLRMTSTGFVECPICKLLI